jgi:IclR family acetate operon transcriptional repressor
MPASDTSGNAVGYQTRSVTRALAILDAFTVVDGPLSVRDLHQIVGLAKPTVSRLARELARNGYLSDVGGAYEIGPKAFELGSRFIRGRQLDNLGRLHLLELAAETKQTACLAMLEGRDVVNLLVASSPQRVQYVTRVGGRDPAYATGLGKALLARLPDDQVRAILGGANLPSYTPNTICALDELLVELRRVRRRGYAVDREERALGLRCVAVAFDLSGMGTVGMSVSGPAADYSGGAVTTFAAAIQAVGARLEPELAQNIAVAATESR